MKVLVTGADGFIGSHLVDALLDRGHEVRALSQYNSFNFRGWLEGQEESANLEIVSGDVRDPFFCKKITEGIDCIFHLAALIAIPYSYNAPQSYVETNVTGTLNICQAALENGCKRVLHTSTSEVYGTALYVPIDEKHPKQAQSPYSASKIGADAMAMSYHNSFDLPLTIVRPFNTYGPRQSARAIIPTIITQIASGMKEIKLGDLTPTRDFNFVLDTANAFVKIAESDSLIGQEVNVATGMEYSMRDTLELIKGVMNSEVEFITDEDRIRPAKSEVQRLLGDGSKLKEATGFSHQYSLEEGLRITCEWFSKKENLNRYKPAEYNV